MKEKRIQIEGQDTQYLVRDNGTIWSEKRNRELKGTLQRNAYPTVYLTFNGKQYNFMIHRLVAEAFCDNPNSYNIVHHKDGNKLNANANNLEWVDDQKHQELTSRKSPEPYKTMDVQKLDRNEWKEIRNYPDYLISKNGVVVNKNTGRILKQTDRNGYKRVTLKDERYSVHRLVYFTFNEDIDDNLYVDHINSDRGDNRLENLRLVTQSENMQNAYSNGHKGQIPILQFDKEGNFIQEFPSMQAAADVLGVSQAAVRSAVNRDGTCKGFKWKKKNI